MSEMIAQNALAGVGDATLGEWREPGRGGVFHIRRRCTPDECDAFGLAVRDVRGTSEEAHRLESLWGAIR